MTLSDEMWAELTAKFARVRDALNRPETQYAYHMAFKTPWQFFRERTIEEAIEGLIKMYEQ